MGHLNLESSAMSESIEMYLLRIALLQENTRPVPVPLLAQELSVSPVSANEMCRKLTDRGLIEYEPYKGVTLTASGEALARRVLRCRRLWEVCFVEKLGIAPREAEEMACRFEHVTPDELADRLAAFLGHPAFSPQNEPIPYDANMPVLSPTRPLAALAVGEDGQIAGATAADGAAHDFMYGQGIRPGAAVTVLAVAADGALLVEIAGRRLSLAAAVARDIHVSPPGQPLTPQTHPEAAHATGS
jgi:DtxR family Mn-dependent transcriptional regulator